MKRTLPQAPPRPSNGATHFVCKPHALERWNQGIHAADEKTDDATISILDAIGFDPFTGGGTTVKRISAALRTIGRDKDVTVNLNSPGGDFFEGLAIYNALRDHRGKVTVNVLGLAASAAAVVAMAGDTVRIGRAAFLMVHNVWVVAMGDRNDLREMSKWLEPFDQATVDIFEARTGLDEKEVAKMLDKETWISGSEAVDKGFADEFLPADAVKENVDASADDLKVRAERIIELGLTGLGMSRTKAREMLGQVKTDKPRAVEEAMPDAGLIQSLTSLSEFVKGIRL